MLIFATDYKIRLCQKNNHQSENDSIYNDDFTTMEFVVKILTQVFYKSEAEAETLMLQVHHSDKAVVGIYSYDVATSKVRKATSMAREAGFPLRLTVEPDKE